MEDRLTPGLYLETTDIPLIRRISDRNTEILKQWASDPSLKIMYVNTFQRVG